MPNLDIVPYGTREELIITLDDGTIIRFDIYDYRARIFITKQHQPPNWLLQQSGSYGASFPITDEEYHFLLDIYIRKDDTPLTPLVLRYITSLLCTLEYHDSKNSKARRSE